MHLGLNLFLLRAQGTHVSVDLKNIFREEGQHRFSWMAPGRVMPSKKQMTVGSTWMLSFSQKNGAWGEHEVRLKFFQELTLSALILTKRVSM